MFGILPQFPRDRDRFGYLGVYEIAVISLSSAIHKARGFKVFDEFSNFAWPSPRIVAEVFWKAA